MYFYRLTLDLFSQNFYSAISPQINKSRLLFFSLFGETRRTTLELHSEANHKIFILSFRETDYRCSFLGRVKERFRTNGWGCFGYEIKKRMYVTKMKFGYVTSKQVFSFTLKEVRHSDSVWSQSLSFLEVHVIEITPKICMIYFRLKILCVR